MQAVQRFCENCGKPLNPQARFCGNCGHPVQPPPVVSGGTVTNSLQPVPAPAPTVHPPISQPQPAPSRTAPPEQVAGVIPAGYTKSGALGLKMTSYTVVLTNYRVIFAQLTSQVQNEQVREARDAAKAQGKGFFGQWGAQLKTIGGQQYLQMTPQAILAEQPDNFYILINQLRQVKIHSPSPVFRSENKEEPTRIEFDAISGKTTLLFNQIDERHAKQLLKQVLGALVH